MPEPEPKPGEDAAILRSPFEYAIVRVIPRVERGEAFNAGIVLMCRVRRYLGARTRLDEGLLVAMSPDCDPEIVRAHLDAIAAIAAGDPGAGPIAALSAPERFHWLVSPSSTIIAPSPVHTGLTADPASTLEHLFRTLVER
ncbi:MAG: DUF3037 domain-containing protein [Chloroflexota bacterium]